ncbi:MAG: response regulator transcription factor [Chloroflexota bacterium]|nr:response regulator transcription factor [Chloroflexota bacterium]
MTDDEPDLVWAVQQHLKRAGYEVLTAHDGLEALAVARRHHPALVILDINMPVLNGLETCQRMRADPILASIPILFLTVDRENSDKVQGLDHGADDYITKPFDLPEFQARIRALLRRHQSPSNLDQLDSSHSSTLRLGEISLDLLTHLVQVGEKRTELTPTEFDLLYFLMTHPQEVFTSRQLLQMVWNYPDEIANPGLVRWHFKNLRIKIEIDPAKPTYIITVAHQGYMLNK